MTPPSFEAIIFDHDGTLIDTESADLETCRILYEEHGFPFSTDYWANRMAGYMGGYDVMLNDLASQNGHGPTRTAILERFQELWKITSEHVGLMPGVAPLLAELHAASYPLALATASDRAWVKHWFTRFQLWPYFQTIVTGDDVTHNKPAPDVYLFAAAQLGIKPERCLVFEDSLPGVIAAKAAGMTVVAVSSPHTRKLSFPQADAIIDTLEIVNIAWIKTLIPQGDDNAHLL